MLFCFEALLPGHNSATTVTALETSTTDSNSPSSTSNGSQINDSSEGGQSVGLEGGSFSVLTEEPSKDSVQSATPNIASPEIIIVTDGTKIMGIEEISDLFTKAVSVSKLYQSKA